MYTKLESRRLELVAKRKAEGKCFLGRKALLLTPRGSKPVSTKISTSASHRPRVLSVCPKRKAACNAWYFEILFNYRVASAKYRAGNLEVKFPEGTYPPWRDPLGLAITS